MAITPAHDSVSTSPTNTFATVNILTEPNVTTGHTFSDGNLKLDFSTAPLIFPSVLGSIAIPNDSGIWYWEVHLTSSNNTGLGVYNENTNLTTDYGTYQSALTDAGLIKFGGSSLQKVYLNTLTEIASSLSSPIIFQLIFDAVNRKLFIKYNNTEPSGQSISSGTSLFPVFSAGKTYTPAFYHGDGGSGTKSGTFIINHGQDHTFGGYPNSLASSSGYSDANGIGSFYYQPPTDALALCTSNLPDPAIDPNVDDLPEDNFKAVTWQGNSTTNTQIDTGGVGTGTGFKPDLIWWKNRDYGHNHGIIDSVRGVHNRLYPDATSASYEETSAASKTVLSFEDTGFKIHTEAGINNSSYKYCAWCWKAGGAPSGATSATGSAKRINSSGTQDDTSCSALATAATSAGASNVITPTLMSINQKAGFSIVKYVGNGTNNSTVPTGLGDVDFAIVKNLDRGAGTGSNAVSDSQWAVYHKSFTSGHVAYLNQTNQAGSATSEYSGGIAKNASNNSLIQLITRTSDGLTWPFSVNSNTDNFILYCWKEIPGFSAFGSFTGNNSTDGPMIHLGFSPALVICKLYTGTSATDYHSWVIYDNVRQTVNPNHSPLYANRSHAEGKRGNTAGDSGGDTLYLDFLSNGFKCRQNGTELNGNGGANDKFIYMAFAEMPQKFSTAR